MSQKNKLKTKKSLGARGGEKAKNFSATMKKFWDYIEGYRLMLAFILIFGILSSVFAVFGPRYIGEAVNVLADGAVKIAGSQGGIDYTAFLKIIGLIIGIYVFSAITGLVQNFIIASFASGISSDFRDRLSKKINRLPLKYFDTKSHGDVLSRVTNDVDNISQMLNQSLGQTISAVMTIVGTGIMMLTISPAMTLIALAVIPIGPGVIGFIIKSSQKFFRQQQQYLGEVNGKVEEDYGGQSIIKIFSAEEKVTEEFDRLNDKLYNSAWKSQFFSGIMYPLTNAIGNLAYVAVCMLGGFLALKGTIKVGNIVSFIQYMREFTQPMSQIAQVSNAFQATAAAAERVFEFLEEPEEDTEENKPAIDFDVKGNVVFENVKFGYEEGKEIIHNFSADIKAGQRVAIVGPTGAGKTTIVKLLMRFYELNGGTISIDGVNIDDIKRHSLRNSFGMVLQDTWLFNGTIMENIRFGNLTKTDEEVIQAAKDANVHRFIKTLPGGYNFEINEESDNISQGQKQLLTIARAFLSDPKILILDEATSSVDTRTELVIQKAMAKLMENRTSFVIAHRLSTIKDADIILVLKEGDIIEQGNHEELIQNNGFYSSLYNSQFEES